ncbi:MYND domain protein [Penicillium argentinense]|uniref:MYND domain protein n=1 Tax=Penicillium argentinense TaxID=1131581 RepID=A0A9W9FMP7_9EURO|nr:MYND domain protein [Penicillium argentinense]KAJ5103046.1 MYND domain protein [Penicillium argentinense]
MANPTSTSASSDPVSPSSAHPSSSSSSSTTTTTRECAQCYIPATEDIKLSTCNRCKRAWYCSRGCQVTDWKYHKAKCAASTTEEPSNIGEPPSDLPGPHYGCTGIPFESYDDAPLEEIKFPYKALKYGKWLHGRPRLDVYRLLFATYRLRIADEKKFLKRTGDIDELNGFKGLGMMLADLERKRGLLPPWWTQEETQSLLGRFLLFRRCIGDAAFWISIEDIEKNWSEDIGLQLRCFGEIITGKPLIDDTTFASALTLQAALDERDELLETVNAAAKVSKTANEAKRAEEAKQAEEAKKAKKAQKNKQDRVRKKARKIQKAQKAQETGVAQESPETSEYETPDTSKSPDANAAGNQTQGASKAKKARKKSHKTEAARGAQKTHDTEVKGKEPAKLAGGEDSEEDERGNQNDPEESVDAELRKLIITRPSPRQDG